MKREMMIEKSIWSMTDLMVMAKNDYMKTIYFNQLVSLKKAFERLTSANVSAR